MTLAGQKYNSHIVVILRLSFLHPKFALQANCPEDGGLRCQAKDGLSPALVNVVRPVGVFCRVPAEVYDLAVRDAGQLETGALRARAAGPRAR